MSFNIPDEACTIKGIKFRKCVQFNDDRGIFSEVFRSEWAPECNYGEEIQLNLSRSVKGALRGLHYHRIQYDWWIPVLGTVQAVLTDLRKDSPTFLKTQVFEISAENSLCVLIPPGVAHGFLALADAAILYAVDRYYDGSDEQGVAWNDDTIAVSWKVSNPILSQRDRNNPTLKELEARGLLPVYSSQS